ncbi:MAG: DUF853 family protein [Clostridiales bacterium]|nr:DUF853 family protein [Candidatus Apopatocola equi]
MYHNGKIFIAKDGDEPLCLLCDKANRHGLIAGATGTGKTITLKVLAESFSDAGVPVFLADVKGDLAGMSRCGTDSEDMQKRIARFGLAECGFNYHAYPTNYWDIFAETGLPLRTTITEMGPVLLAQLLELTPTQEDILNIVFRIADDEGLLLLDSKDLRSMLAYVAENAKEYSNSYGNINKASLNVIQRGMAALETQGANVFFGEPALNIRDWIRQDNTGKGYINILDSRSLINNPKMYAMFLLWLLSELFEVLPEVGDAEKPKLIFFFDEAHLLFSDAPKPLLRKIEQVVKLIRSKGVGVYFITQNPADIPDGVLAQLGNKVQHALHAYTPADMKGLKAAADSFRANPAFDTREVLQTLGTGEALVSFLLEDGTPSMVRKASILPPQSRMGTISEEERMAEVNGSPLFYQYSETIDRDSAYELLQRGELQKTEQAQEEAERIAAEKAAEKARIAAEKAAEKERLAAEKAAEKARIAEEKAAEKERLAAEKAAEKEKERKKAALTGAAKTAAGTVGRELGKTVGGAVGGKFGKTLGGNLGASLGRGILGTLFGK